MDELEDAKEGLIDTIEWYRDEWHKNEFGHTDMIEEVKKATTIKELEPIERVVDMWLDS